MARKATTRSKKTNAKSVEALKHGEAKRTHIPTAELQSFVAADEAAPKPKRYPRNPDLDPQLVWRGKDEQDGEDLIVETVPIYIQEKVKPEAIIADLKRRSETARKEREEAEEGFIPDLFHDFNGLPDEEATLEFYSHEKNWSNRMILGDSLLVMNSLAEKEALKGRVQCIYFDPPYGIKFNSNWQPSTKSRDLSFEHGFKKLTKKEREALSLEARREYDAKVRKLEGGISREPEMVRAFRDTWSDGIHSYLSYLRDRLVIARELLAETGSIFLQIGDENVHLVVALMDEVFGRDNRVSLICVTKTAGQTAKYISGVADYVIWFAKSFDRLKFIKPLREKSVSDDESGVYRCIFDEALKVKRLSDNDLGAHITANGDTGIFRLDNITSQKPPGDFPVIVAGRSFGPGKGYWKTGEVGMERLKRANRLNPAKNSITYIRYLDDFRASEIGNVWTDMGTGSFTEDKVYVVQTATKIVQRCILMTTDPGDLVLDPTCGSGTTAYVAEHWGRRWITIDTSRVALALARQRLMASRYPAYLLQDSEEGAYKEAELTHRAPKQGPFHRQVRQGFVYERVPHVTLKSIANNERIDVIWETWRESLEPLRAKLNEALGKRWEEWEIPREAEAKWPAEVRKVHAAWWKARADRQAEIDASIAANADTEYLVDKPYEDKSKVRVTGPFTVESLSPHRVLSTDDEEDQALAEAIAEEEGRPQPQRTKSLTRAEAEARAQDDFVRVVLDNLKKSGVHNTKKGEQLDFTELKPWPGGRYVAAEGRYMEGKKEKRAGIVIGPEYGTVSWGLVRDAAKEAVELFDTLIVLGFAFEPTLSEDRLARFGSLTVLKARMNNDLHMKDALKATGAGNLFVVFGEPDIKVETQKDGRLVAEILGVDIFDPTTGEVRSSSIEDIACWFIDTDYDEESFFVRHAYFLGGNDPYKKLRTTLKAEIDPDAWDALYSARSRPFEKSSTGKIAVKVINHYGDEVLKVFSV